MGTARGQSLLSATEILLLNLKIPPFSRAHLSHLSVSFVP